MVELTPAVGPTGRSTYHWRTDPFLRWRLATYGALALVAALAWWATGRQDGMRMSSQPGPAAAFLLTWVVMMSAMMFPSVAPTVATYVSAQRGRRARSMPAPAGASMVFVGGYLVSWAGAGVGFLAVLELAAVVVDDASPWQPGRWLTVAVLLGAAVYELAPAKHACLRRCRNPVGFVVHQWRDGRGGALRMGVEQGAWCVGCCWGLMAALVALGSMSLTWMAVVALLVAVEKLLPWRRAGTAVVTGVLTLLALAVAFAPDRVPGVMG